MSTDLPSVKSAWQDPALTADTKLAVFGKQLETAQAPPSFPTWEQVVTSFDTEMEKVTKTGRRPGRCAEDGAEAGRVHRHRQLTMSTATERDAGTVGAAQAGTDRAGPRPPAGASARACGRGGPRGSSPCRSCCCSSSSRVWPVLQSLFMSFTDTKAKDLRTPFSVDIVGLENYTKALSDETFLQAARNTAYFVLVGVPLTLILGAGRRGRARPRDHEVPVGLPAGLLHPGRHLDRRGRRRLAVPAPGPTSA